MFQGLNLYSFKKKGYKGHSYNLFLDNWENNSDAFEADDYTDNQNMTSSEFGKI